MEGEAFCNSGSQALWVPAFAGTTVMQKPVITLLSQIIAPAQV
jgi:hypothetical protein